MRERISVLNDIIKYKKPINKYVTELSEFKWDTENPILIVQKTHLSNILTKYLDGILTESEIENWANIIEVRDDIGFSKETFQEIVFDLANPILYGDINDKRIQLMLNNL